MQMITKTFIPVVTELYYLGHSTTERKGGRKEGRKNSYLRNMGLK